MEPTEMKCVIPSRLGVGEGFDIKVKLLGAVRPVRWEAYAFTYAWRYEGPFNRNAIDHQYCDDILEEWNGAIRISGDGLEGPGEILFDNTDQGVFPGDKRPIKTVGGFSWNSPGFHFVHLVDPISGCEAWSNPVYVTPEPPTERLYWGDPHWQAIISDGLRSPEELYDFARDEAFLDFGAITDHVELVTDRQWDYMTAVTNDYNDDGRFVTLVGQEWTSPTCGHRNIYFRGDSGPIIRAYDPNSDTVAKMWKCLEGLEALAIPHHCANKVMGVDWGQGWGPIHEKAVEIYSIWGSSECSGDDNTKPILRAGGELKGQHVIDALRLGYRFSFVGGGDIHDGRPGDGLTYYNNPEHEVDFYPKGLTAAFVEELTRTNIYDAIKEGKTYATCQKRIYLDVDWQSKTIRSASEDGLSEVCIVRNGITAARLTPKDDPRVFEETVPVEPLGENEFCYVRVMTTKGDLAWSSPVWGQS
jgi:hypothetical protein